jgi:hypothetical protein
MKLTVFQIAVEKRRDTYTFLRFYSLKKEKKGRLDVSEESVTIQLIGDYHLPGVDGSRNLSFC